MISPTLPRSDSLNSGLNDSEFLREFSVTERRRMAFSNLIGSQFCSSMRQAGRLPVLADFVAHVIERSTCKKVSRVHAYRIVAGMQDAKACRNHAVMEFITEPVSLSAFSFIPERRVPGTVNSACPQPAGFSKLNLRPESFRRRNCFCVLITHSCIVSPYNKPAGVPAMNPNRKRYAESYDRAIRIWLELGRQWK